jgi:hypothetical protein
VLDEDVAEKEGKVAYLFEGHAIELICQIIVHPHACEVSVVVL